MKVKITTDYYGFLFRPAEKKEHYKSIELTLEETEFITKSLDNFYKAQDIIGKILSPEDYPLIPPKRKIGTP